MTPSDQVQARDQTLAQLRLWHAAEPTAWVRREVPGWPATPTPLTWGVMQTLMSATGGMGLMLADLGAPPDPTLGDSGAYDLVAGRPMLNLARAGRMRGADVHFRYPLAAYRADPASARDAEPAVELERSLGGLARLPRMAWRLYRMGAAPRALLPTFAGPFATLTLPGFRTAANRALAEGTAGLNGEQLSARFAEWQHRTFVEFGREALKPAALAEAAARGAARLLAPKLGARRATAAVHELRVGARAPADHDLAAALGKLSRGTLGVAALLKRFGHRAADDLELSCPRYAERPDSLPPHPAVADGFADLTARLDRLRTSPTPSVDEPEALARVVTEARLTGPYRDRLARATSQMRTYLGLATAAHDGLTAGMAVMRQTLIGRGEGAFFLTPAELPEWFWGDPTRGELARRRQQHREAELALRVPDLLFGDDLEVIALGPD